MIMANLPRSVVLLTLSLSLGLSAGCQDRRADKAYLKGDYEKSAKELESLANMGEPRAQYDLAVLYDKGLGVPQSDAQALKWYSRAAEHGDRRAQYNLGLMYMNGQGIPPDYVLAYYWISLSLAQGDEHAAAAREYLAEKMTPEQIAHAQNMVTERLRTAQRPEPQVHHGAP
jgi:TPR repeat protein